MHGSLDKQPQDDRSVYQSFSIKLIALPVLFIVALVGMAVLATRPGVAGRLARAAPVINLLRQLGLTPPR